MNRAALPETGIRLAASIKKLDSRKRKTWATLADIETDAGNATPAAGRRRHPIHPPMDRPPVWKEFFQACRRRLAGHPGDGSPRPPGGRRNHVKLTAEGLRVSQQLHNRAHELERALSDVVRADDFAAAVRVLVQLCTALERLRSKEQL
jgi:hypothetical protein